MYADAQPQQQMASRNNVLVGSAPKELSVHENARQALSLVSELVNRMEQFRSRCGVDDENKVAEPGTPQPISPDSLRWTVAGLYQTIQRAHHVMDGIERVA